MLAPKHLVAVVWDDAHGDALGDLTEEETRRDFHKPAPYVTFGLLVVDDAEGVTLACDHSAADKTYRGRNFIPRAMIKEIVDFGIPRRPKPRKPRTARALPLLDAQEAE